MSPTPRNEALTVACCGMDDTQHLVELDHFARILERELIALSAENAELKAHLTELTGMDEQGHEVAPTVHQLLTKNLKTLMFGKFGELRPALLASSHHLGTEDLVGVLANICGQLDVMRKEMDLLEPVIQDQRQRVISLQIALARKAREDAEFAEFGKAGR